MNKVRLWTLGNFNGSNPEKWILPTTKAIENFKEKLRRAKAVDDTSSEASERMIDIVCGPYVQCTIMDEATDKVLVPVKQEDGTFLYKLEDV